VCVLGAGECVCTRCCVCTCARHAGGVGILLEWRTCTLCSSPTVVVLPVLGAPLGAPSLAVLLLLAGTRGVFLQFLVCVCGVGKCMGEVCVVFLVILPPVPTHYFFLALFYPLHDTGRHSTFLFVCACALGAVECVCV